VGEGGEVIGGAGGGGRTGGGVKEAGMGRGVGDAVDGVESGRWGDGRRRWGEMEGEESGG